MIISVSYRYHIQLSALCFADIWYPVLLEVLVKFPGSKVHGANMGSAWVLSAPGGPTYVWKINHLFLNVVFIPLSVWCILSLCTVYIATCLIDPIIVAQPSQLLYLHFYASPRSSRCMNPNGTWSIENVLSAYRSSNSNRKVFVIKHEHTLSAVLL